MENIGIICIATGVYKRFRDRFYEPVNANFCTTSQKNFYLFTDSVELTHSKLPNNVNPTLIPDKGWGLNVMLRSEMFLSIENELLKNDFVFNPNSNYRAVKPTHDAELLPDAANGWLCGLCFDFYTQREPNTFTYDKNANTQAYIPYGKGRCYFAGGFYAGRTTGSLDMILDQDKWFSINDIENIKAVRN